METPPIRRSFSETRDFQHLETLPHWHFSSAERVEKMLCQVATSRSQQQKSQSSGHSLSVTSLAFLGGSAALHHVVASGSFLASFNAGANLGWKFVKVKLGESTSFWCFLWKMEVP